MRSNLRLKLLGLSAMLLGLMAFGTGSAQAANWMVGANNVTSLLLPTLQVKEIENLTNATDPGKHLVLLTIIGGAAVKILCTGAEFVGVKLETEGKLTNGGDVKFTGCKTFLNGSTTESIPCKPGKGSGVILSLPGKGQLGLFGGAKLTKIEPSAGTVFAHIEFGEECALPAKVPVEGSLLIKDCVNVEATSLDHLIEVDSTSVLWVISNTPEHKATIHGSALVALVGTTDADAAWSGLAE